VIAIATVLVAAGLSTGSARPQNFPASPDKAADFPTFAVKEGTTVQKRFEIQHDLTVQKIQLSGAATGSTSQQQLELQSEVVLEVADTYRKTSPVRPLLLQRVFKSGTYHIDFAFSSATGQKVPDTWDAESPMKNQSVVFTWVPEEKDFSRHFDEVEGAEEHLSTLTEDLDLRCLLPGPVAATPGSPSGLDKDDKGAAETPRVVREGDRWTLELKPLATLFSPGGSIPMNFVKGGNGGLKMAIAAGVGGPLSPVFAGTIKGNCAARWVKTESTDKGRLAVIELTFDLETEADRTEFVRRYLRQDEDDEDSPVRHAGVQWKLSGGTGTLRWNLDAGRFESLEVVGREDVSSDVQFAKGAEASSQLLSMAGSIKVTAGAGSTKGVAGVVPPKK
jgi:hypothetical protein